MRMNGAPTTSSRCATLTAGDELVFDYAMTEHSLVAPLACCCGSADCQGEIRPWRDRDDEWRDQNADVDRPVSPGWVGAHAHPARRPLARR